MPKNLKTILLLVLGLLALSSFVTGCADTIPKEALMLQPESLSLRELQTRKFDTSDEAEMLRAAAGLIQDMGFQIDESEAALGVLVASKNADATDAGQVAGAIIVGVLIGTTLPWDTEQKIRASLVTRPVSKTQTALRVTFQRTVWNNQKEISKIEGIQDVSLYREFFSKLSKALFLEAHQL